MNDFAAKAELKLKCFNS